MSNTFFTSDTHFHHANIIRYSNRPFRDSVEMNNKLIENWNAVVQPDDVIYHLGDFTFGRDDYMLESVLNRLNGYIIFIEGNHDKLARRNKHRFYNYHYGHHEVTINGQHIVMNHYPMVVWNKKHHGSWMLCGHTHYNLPVSRQDSMELGRLLDVGVDGNDYKPYSFDDVARIMNTKPMMPRNPLFSDHHGRNSSDAAD